MDPWALLLYMTMLCAKEALANGVHGYRIILSTNEYSCGIEFTALAEVVASCYELGCRFASGLENQCTSVATLNVT